MMFIIWLLMLGQFSFAQNYTPLLTHPDPDNEREFQNVYQGINTKPSIATGASIPTYSPSKIGDLYISTSTSKVYIATATARGSWAVLN